LRYIPEAMLRTLSLDAGGVLVRPNWPRISAVFAAHGVVVRADVLAAQELPVMRELDSVQSIARTTDGDRVGAFLLRVLQCAGVDTSGQACTAAIEELRRIHGEENLWEDVFEDVRPALERFAALGLTLVVLSNANGTVRKKLDRLGMTQWFASVVDSGEEGVEKPDPRFFVLGLSRVGAERTTTLHVGDLFHVDIVGARAAGIQAVLIDRGGLQQDRDCIRFRDLCELAAAVERGCCLLTDHPGS
jgi:HAD superfamily hydrolase (TIGR01509 family)